MLVVKRGRGHTINAKLEKEKARRAAKGKNLDIQFPPPYFKLCGKHAQLFKSEATVCIRQKAPLQVSRWKEILLDDKKVIWKHMKVSKILIYKSYFHMSMLV